MKKLADVFTEQNKVLKELKEELFYIHNDLTTINSISETQKNVVAELTIGLTNISTELGCIRTQLEPIKTLCCCSKEASAGIAQEPRSSSQSDMGYSKDKTKSGSKSMEK